MDPPERLDGRPTPGPVIRLEQVEKRYRSGPIETLALSGIDLTIDPGEWLAIMGPSGSGKSTLLNVIGLLDAPSRGRLLLDGRDVASLRPIERARLRGRRIGFVFQSFHLVRDLSLEDNVEIPLLYQRVPARQRRRRIAEALELVGLGSRIRQRPGQLSGGQQQRAAIARAIVGRPSLLLADEPTGNLDSHMGAEIIAILRRLNRQRGTTIVMVTHDQALADATDRIVRLFDGRAVA